MDATSTFQPMVLVAHTVALLYSYINNNRDEFALAPIIVTLPLSM